MDSSSDLSQMFRDFMGWTREMRKCDSSMGIAIKQHDETMVYKWNSSG